MSHSINFKDVCCSRPTEVYAFVRCKNRINNRLSEKPKNQPLCLVASTRFHNFHQVVFDIENMQATSINTWLTQVQRCKSYFQTINIAQTAYASPYIDMGRHVLCSLTVRRSRANTHIIQQIGAFDSFIAYEIMHAIHVPCRIQRFCSCCLCDAGTFNIISTHIICPYKWY